MSHQDDDEVALEPFASALRARTAGADRETIARTRDRVVESGRRRSRGPRFAVALAAAAILFGGSAAWAVWSGALRGADGDGDGAATTERPTQSHEPTPPREAPVIAEPISREEALPALPLPPVPTPSPSTASRPVAMPPAPVDHGESESSHAADEGDVAAEAEAPVDPAERRAYDAADRLHFTAHDWPAAIRAWDAYLAAFPRGRYVPEARWNRAIALVRAERRTEAREALEPIAAGSLGGYRQREAASLLSALEDAAP
jgi:hypothetical protein